MSAEYKGYESLLDAFELYQKQSPSGISLKKNRNTINLQFKIGNTKRNPYGCNCSFTLDGMANALSKAHKVADKLKEDISLTEFWEWYNREIKDIGKVENDLLTFREVIKLVENDFWAGLDKRKKKRNKTDASCQKSWYDSYGVYFKELPLDKVLNWQDIQQEIKSRESGTNRYKESVRVFKKIARLANNKPILDNLEKLKTTQTEFREQQEIDLEEFIKWRDKALGITKKLHGNCNLDIRKQGLWVLGMQIVYGLRISEIFAIKNLNKPSYDPKTNKVIVYAYNDIKRNPHRLIYLGDRTVINTTIKTGARLARPMLSPKYPNLYTDWDLQNPKLPTNKPKEKSAPTTYGCFYPNLIGGWLKDWKAPFTQTHADRRLGNLLGLQAGISQEVRAKNLGHNVLTNDRHYTTGSIQTQIDILTQSNKQAIDFTSGLLEAKRVIEKFPNSQVAIVELLAKVYQKSEVDIEELLD